MGPTACTEPQCLYKVHFTLPQCLYKGPLYLYLYHTTLTTEKHPCPRQYWNPQSLSRRAAADLRLRPRGHWDRRVVHMEAFSCCYVEIKNWNSSRDKCVQSILYEPSSQRQRPSKKHPTQWQPPHAMYRKGDLNWNLALAPARILT